MQYAEILYDRLRALIRAELWDGWFQNRPELSKGRRDARWRVHCGDGRYDPIKRNALFSKTNGIALNFQVVGADQKATKYEFCLAWPEGWRLMYHWNVGGCSWPLHPEYHVQFDAPQCGAIATPPPFVLWRLPFAEDQPERLLEYLTAQTLAS